MATVPSRSRFALRLSPRVQIVLMLTPYLLGLTILTVLPTLAALPLAFTNYNALETPRFLGLSNVRELFHDPIYQRALFNSLLFMAIASPLRLIGALSVALLLQRPGRDTAIARAMVYLPTVVPDIAWAIVWLWVLNPLYGPLNQMLASVGIAGPAWGTTEWSARAALIIMAVWQFGEGFIICLAALQDVPKELQEQAAVDGSSAARTFWHITIPVIAPILLLFLMRDSIHTLQSNFVPALIVTRGGPNYATTFLPLYIYTTAFSYLRFGYAAAMTWSLTALTAIAIGAQYWIASRWRLGFRDVE